MDINEIGNQRLKSQHVSIKTLNSIKELVGWMGALQAQDLISAKWAIGVRLNRINEKVVDDAINSGDIIRTHIMRPTWHLVSSEDYHDIMKLTSPSVNISLKTRQKQLELDENFFQTSNANLVKILEGGNHLTREELQKELSKEISDIDSSRMNHILLRAELDELICSGVIKNRQHSYALLSERIKIKDVFDRDHSLTKLASKYFASHGPATLFDFNWWSGLSISDCKKAIELIKHKLQTFKIDSQSFWFMDMNTNSTFKSTKKKSLFLLPAYDEFLISYRDRSAVLSLANQQRAVSSNGIFRPIVVYDGRVIGLWNKKLIRGTLRITTELSIEENESIRSMIEKAADHYYQFNSIK